MRGRGSPLTKDLRLGKIPFHYLSNKNGLEILKWILNKQHLNVLTGFHLAQGTDHWRTLLNAVMKFRVP
jgi:hypothetical protein